MFSRFLIRLSYLLLLSALPLSWLQAAEVEGLYQASSRVSSRDDERERLRAFRSAMRKVLIKLSGREDIVENQVIARALENAQPFVEAMAYRSLQNVSSNATELKVSFFRSEIRNLLDAAGIPIWPANRPDTLLWLVEQDVSGNRVLAGSAGSDDSLLNVIQLIAAEKGVPLITPIMDLEDQISMRPEALWSFDEAAILQASQRYQSESILAVRVYRAGGDEVIARAIHLFRDKKLELDGFQSVINDFLAGSLNMVSSELADNYAVLLSGIAESSGVALVVEGIAGIADYAGLLAYLDELAVVANVQVLKVNGSTMTLELNTGGQLRQLIESIALETKMLPLAEPERLGSQVNLRYLWQSSRVVNN